MFTPNGDGKADELKVTFQLAAPATVRLRVLRDGAWVATPFTGPLGAGVQRLGWDGAKRVGLARDGAYVAVVEATDAVGTGIDHAAVPEGRAPARDQALRRPAAALGVGGGHRDGAGQRLAATAQDAGAGMLALTGIKRVRTLVVVARDAAGNTAVLRRP